MSTGTHTNDDDRLMRYFDEELSSEEMEIVRAELVGDEELSAKLDGLVHLRELVGEAMEDVGAELDAEAMFAEVQARLGEDAEEDDDPMFPAAAAEAEEAAAEDVRPPLRVVPGGKRDSVPAEVVREEPPSRTGVWIGIAGGLAAAAAVLFFLLRPPGERRTDPDPGNDPGLAAAPAGSEIEDVDFGYSTGSIFTVDDPDAEAQYAVVWISDEKVGEEEGSPDALSPETPSPETPSPAPPEAPELDEPAPDAPGAAMDDEGEAP